MSNVTNLRLRVLPKFPSRIEGTDGVAVDRDGGALVVKLSYQQLAVATDVSDMDETYLAVRQPDGSYARLAFSQAVNAIGEVIIGQNLAAINALPSDTDTAPYFTGPGNAGLYALSNYVRSISAAADEESFREAIGAASAEQGEKADTAVQPGDLATVATSGSYNDLSDKPALGSAAAADVSDFATAAQGTKADSALQAADIPGIVDQATVNNTAFPTRASAVAESIQADTHSVTLNGDASEGDGLGGLFIDTDNGSTDTFTSADGRTWYRSNAVIQTKFGDGSVFLMAAKSTYVGMDVPTGNRYFNTVFAPDGGNILDPSTPSWRNTLMGHRVGSKAVLFSRTDAYGQGALGFAKWAQRTTAIGTLSLCWQGIDDPVSSLHDFWPNGDPGASLLPPTDPAWDAYGLESRNPGNARSGILATVYATSPDQIEGNVGTGRNTLLHLVKGAYNTAGGYNSQAHAWSGSYNTTYGNASGRDNLFSNGLTAIGAESAMEHQSGDNDLFAGVTAGKEVRRGGGNTIIGAYTGRGIFDLKRSVFIGHEAGQGLGLGTDVSDILSIQNAFNRLPLISGNFVAEASGVAGSLLGVGINILPSAIKAGLHVRRGDSLVTPQSTASALMVEDSGSNGLTIATPATSSGRLSFSAPGQIDDGGLIYNHQLRQLGLRAGASFRVLITSTGIGFHGAAAAARPTGYTARTGTTTRAGFDTTTVTLPQLAERVKALLDDFTTYGLIGA